MTTVCNRNKEICDEYIGRGSLFGNPFTSMPLGKTKAEFQAYSRPDSIAKYRKYFLDRIRKDVHFRKSVMALKDTILGCYCKPLDCHGDVIAEFLDYPEHFIPKGKYCYESFSDDENGKVLNQLCPFWDIRTNRRKQENGYCHYLQMGDWESGDFTLLWDQCKECRVNK